MATQPLFEVFGHPVGDFSPAAVDSRARKLCPFNNTVPQCTKVSKKNPLGACSMQEGGQPI